MVGDVILGFTKGEHYIAVWAPISRFNECENDNPGWNILVPVSKYEDKTGWRWVGITKDEKDIKEIMK